MAGHGRIASLDGLRGIAAAAVVYAHIEYFLPSRNPWILLDTGDVAVALFFSLSGFLMAVLYGNRRLDAADYLVHRFARIYPVYLVAVLAVAVLSVALPGAYLYPIDGLSSLARHLLMFGSSGVFWSIPPEIQFYLFFLLLWLWFSDPDRYRWVAIGTAALLAVLALFDFPGPGILLTSKLPYFVFGTIAGRLYDTRSNRPEGLLAGVITLGLLVFFLLFEGFFALPGSFWGIGTALMATVIVYLAACGSPVSAFVLASRPLVFLGKISFSLYLFHLPAIFLCMWAFEGLMPVEGALVVSIAISVVVAWVVHTTLEVPAQRHLLSLWRARRVTLPVAAE